MEISKYKPDLRERVFARGLGYPSDEELLMLILGSGVKGCPVEALATKIKKAVDKSSRENLVESLLKIQGVGLRKALSIAAAVEFGRRKSQIFSLRIDNAQTIVPHIQHYGFKSTEHFITITLSGAREVLSQKVVAIGNADSAVISPREIFFEAAKQRAASIIIAHNHPNGTAAPSEFDLDTTAHLGAASEILGISLLDHIILTKNDYFSFAEHGLLNHCE